MFIVEFNTKYVYDFAAGLPSSRERRTVGNTGKIRMDNCVSGSLKFLTYDDALTFVEGHSKELSGYLIFESNVVNIDSTT